MATHFLAHNLEKSSLSVLRCELNKITDSTTPSLAIAVTHVGGSARHSTLTIAKLPVDHSYEVRVMDERIYWDSSNSGDLFKAAIVMARKIIREHNNLVKLPHSKMSLCPPVLQHA